MRRAIIWILVIGVLCVAFGAITSDQFGDGIWSVVSAIGRTAKRIAENARGGP